MHLRSCGRGRDSSRGCGRGCGGGYGASWDVPAIDSVYVDARPTHTGTHTVCATHTHTHTHASTETPTPTHIESHAHADTCNGAAEQTCLPRTAVETAACVPHTRAHTQGHTRVCVCACVLHMRGEACCRQPLALPSSVEGGVESADYFCWNGEVFGGLAVEPGRSDTETLGALLTHTLVRAHSGAHSRATATRADGGCHSVVSAGQAIAEVMSRIRGPWAFIYWHAASNTAYFGRDPVGRRSLLMRRCSLPCAGAGRTTNPTDSGGGATLRQFTLASVSTVFMDGVEDPTSDMRVAHEFEELPPLGVYALRLQRSNASARPEITPDGEAAHAAAIGGARALIDGTKELWRDEELGAVLMLMPWSADTATLAHGDDLRPIAPLGADTVAPVSIEILGAASRELLSRLAAAVAVRVREVVRTPALPAQSSPPVPVCVFPSTETRDVMHVRRAIEDAGADVRDLPYNALEHVRGTAARGVRPASVCVLFSGGLDSVVLATLVHHFVPADESIDLLNVCFAKDHRSPDRLAAIRAVHELRALYPSRCWQLVCIDTTYDSVLDHKWHLVHLLAPSLSHMDFNIGAALWFAASGVGYVDVCERDGDFEFCEPLATSAALTDDLRYADESSSSAALPLSEIVRAAGTDLGKLLREAAAATPGKGSSERDPLPPSLRAAVANWQAETIERVRAAASIPSATADLAKRDDVPDACPPRACSDSGAPAAAASGAPFKQPKTKECRGFKKDGTTPCDAPASRRCARRMCGHCCVTAARKEEGEAAVTCAFHPVHARGRGARGAGGAAATAAPSKLEPVEAPPARRLRVLVRSPAKVLLNGIGADEQLGGYGRHKTCFSHGSWERLQMELKLDVSRIWKRNLGRDDRICSDHSRELRLPFLDEDFMAFVRALPLPFITDPREPLGAGDKRILRVAAMMLGLRGPAQLVKRAIHFGSRIAKQSNVHAFGSNRAGRGDAAALNSLLGASAGGESEEES